jgi:membrane protease YdiL (CAAX protease family)
MTDPATTLSSDMHPEPPFARHREVALVGCSVLALFFAVSARRFLVNGIGTAFRLTDIGLIGTLATEIVLTAIWLPILRQRGWAVRHLGRPYENLDLLRGISLACGAWVAYILAYNVAFFVSPAFALRLNAFRPTGTVSWLTVVALAMLNPVFEETLYEGYIVNALRRSGWAVALGASVAVRVALHVYQGPVALVSILPTGLLFTGYYLRTRRLWPLVAAHMLLDVVALAPYAHGLA